ncbi:hypothetical protein [Gracilibacillus alcaliphilus]|nr:hypothetical protein [Gracilibacillus alcaliphilus]MBM7678531.1 hypothetical protein [Gracilibacillus alcaliphilus]
MAILSNETEYILYRRNFYIKKDKDFSGVELGLKLKLFKNKQAK